MIAAAHCETSCAEIRSGCQVRNVAFWPLADIVVAPPDVRFQGKSGHGVRNAKCPFLTQNGHLVLSPSEVGCVRCAVLP